MAPEPTAAAEPSRLDLVERRRIAFEQLLWQVPSISFAGQAFLLSIVLRPDTSAFGRLVASTFGLVAAIAVLSAFVKHRYTEELHAEWVNWHQRQFGGGGLRTDDMLRDAFPPHRPDRFSWEIRPLRWLAARSAFQVWAVALMLFTVGDIVLVAVSIAELAGAGTLLDSS